MNLLQYSCIWATGALGMITLKPKSRMSDVDSGS